MHRSMKANLGRIVAVREVRRLLFIGNVFGNQATNLVAATPQDRIIDH